MLNDDFRREVIFTILRLGIVATASYLSVKWVMSVMDPTREKKNSAKLKVRLFRENPIFVFSCNSNFTFLFFKNRPKLHSKSLGLMIVKWFLMIMNWLSLRSWSILTTLKFNGMISLVWMMWLRKSKQPLFSRFNAPIYITIPGYWSHQKEFCFMGLLEWAKRWSQRLPPKRLGQGKFFQASSFVW